MSEYKLVPVEPTDEMIEAGDKVADIHNVYGHDLYIENTDEVYKAMLSASPTADTVTIDRDEYEAMKADAERYRWLHAENAKLEYDTFVVLGHDCNAEEKWQKYWVGSDLDQAIDQARKI